MTVKITRPSIDIRGTLDELNKPSGIAGNAMLRAETPQEQFNLIGAGRKNLIINGAMQVAQRGTSATTIDSNKYTTCDRFLQEFPPASWSVNSTQETDGPSGFSYSHKIAATSGASLGPSDYMIPFEYRVEGYDASRLGLGTTEAKDVTLSFWIKSNRTGTNTVDFTKQGGGVGIFIARQYTIISANTWEYKTITIPANPNATNVHTDSANAFTIFWWMLSGRDFNSGEIVDSWGLQTPGNRAPGTSSTIASGDYWQMTGVQLEIGSVATPFEHRSYGEELALCQRYYYSRKLSWLTCFFLSYINRFIINPIYFPVPMRTSPTVAWDSGSIIVTLYGYNAVSGTTTSSTVHGNLGVSTESASLYVDRVGGGQAPVNTSSYSLENSSALFSFSAEL